MSNLHTIREWESRIPVNARFEHVFFNTKREVTKVCGVIILKNNVKVAEENKNHKCYVKVHWDGFGQCYIDKDKRKKNMDIKF